jgi:hypothetical protein
LRFRSARANLPCVSSIVLPSLLSRREHMATKKKAKKAKKTTRKTRKGKKR